MYCKTSSDFVAFGRGFRLMDMYNKFRAAIRQAEQFGNSIKK